MRNRLLGAIVLVIAVLVFSPGSSAQNAPPSGAGKAIPNLAGVWDVPIDPGRRQTAGLCGEPACRALFGLPAPQRMDKNVEEPQMLPWAEQQYKAVREGLTDPNAFARQEFRPFWGGCMPEGPTESMRRRGFEIVQFSDMVLCSSITIMRCGASTSMGNIRPI